MVDLRDVPPDELGPALVNKVVEAVPMEGVGPWRVKPEVSKALDGFLGALPAGERIALLKAVVRQISDYRGTGGDRPPRIGGLLDATAVALYRARLPLTEDDLCDLLVLSRSDHGHGEDARPPFDLARAHQRKHGYSVKLAEAIEVFIGNLPKATTIKVRELRRSAALLAVLDPRSGPVRARPWWIDEVRASLSEIDGDERREWERLVLTMSVSERMQMPKNWERHVRSTIEELGTFLVLRRLKDWWPDPERTPQISFEGSGAQLLKHFIWMLELLPREPGEQLVCRLVAVDWPRRDPPLAILKPATAYLTTATSRTATAARGTLTLAMSRGTR